MGKTTKTFVILVSSIFLLYLILLAGFRIAMDRTPGMDHFHYLDEDKRYEFLLISGLVLRDEEKRFGLAGDIEKYIQKDPYVYITGNSWASTGTTKDGITYYYDYDPNSGEEIQYDDPSEIPQYMILNYETGEAVQYLYFEDIPEEEQAIFEEPLTEECLKDRTCYEE